MAGGEVCYGVFGLVADGLVVPARLDIPPFKIKECCFKLPVLAQLVSEGSDEFKNDKHSVIQKYPKGVYTAVIPNLEKYENGDYVFKESLLINNLGTAYLFGEPNYMTDTRDKYQYVGYNIDWQKVLDVYGEGTYRIEFQETNTSGEITSSYHLFEFCLKRYLPHRADRTVRFTWYTRGYRGDVFDDRDTWDFVKPAKTTSRGWFNQIRLPDSWFGDNRSEFERETIKYQNGQVTWIKDEQIEYYNFHSGMFPAELHAYIKTEILQADEIIVDDYNSKNPNIVNNKEVRPTGGYEPSWNYNNRRAMVSVEFEQKYQNRIKRRC